MAERDGGDHRAGRDHCRDRSRRDQGLRPLLRRLELGEQGGQAREPLVRRRREPAHERPPQPRGQLRRRRVDLAGEHAVEEVGARDVAERMPAAQRLVERDAEAELVGARVGGLAPVLLGRHVQRRADEVAGQRHRDAEQAVAPRAPRRHRRGRCGHLARRLDLVGAAREAEVRDLDAAVVADQHVVRLEVAVDDADRVGRDQSAPGGDEHRDDAAPRWRARRQVAPQRFAAHVLHREEHVTVDAADVVDGDDVGMRQPRHRLRLAQQPRAALERGDRGVGADQLDRDVAFELGIVREVDDAHPALRHRLADDVAPDVLPGDGGWDGRTVTARRATRPLVGGHRRRPLVPRLRTPHDSY